MPLPYLDYLAAAVDEFARVLERGELSTPVRSCPGWTLADLGEHLVETHRWALSQVLAAEPAPLPTRGTLGERFRLGADELIRALSEHPWDEPCPAIYPPDVVGTWARRQALETAIHAWDATDACGDPTSIDSALAADGVAEVAEDMYPRQVRLGRQAPLEAGVDFALSDAGTRVRLRGASGGAAATLVGEASAVLLLLWGRVPLEATSIELRGDATAVRAMLDAAIVP